MILNYVWRKVLGANSRLRNWNNFQEAKAGIRRARKLGQDLIIIFGTPQHSNIGDIAIEWAEEEFIKDKLPNYTLLLITVEAMGHYFSEIKTLIRKEDILLGHGGGNMGDTYPVEEEFRRRVINEFRGNKILTFPQTVYFSATRFGDDELAKTQAVYAIHPNLTLIARENVSFDYMRNKFPNNRVILTPDIVLSSSAFGESTARLGALLCLRADKESVLNPSQRKNISDFLSDKYEHVKITDTVSYSPFFPFMSKRSVLVRKLNQFRESEFVVTDRLHGMVFAAITGTPCIALTNFNHKVLGTYQWIKNLTYIRFCNDTKELDVIYNKMDKRPGVYDSDIFASRWQPVIDIIENN